MMDGFVRLRLHAVRGLDLSLFQFDPDLTFAVFFFNADRTLYGRYGSRSDFADAEREISLDGLARAMEAVLDLHARYPAEKASLIRKTTAPPRHKTLMEFPWAKQQSRALGHCAHCHHLQNAEQMSFRLAGEPLPDRVLFPWPMPDVLGLKLDPRQKARLERILPGSPAEAAGLRAGDEILSLEGQPIISIADVQWVLHSSGEKAAALEAVVARDGEMLSLELPLPRGWRRASDSSWRYSSELLRRLGLGEMGLEELSPAARRRAGLGEDDLALQVAGMGVRAPALKAGFQMGDTIIVFDGETGRRTESEILAHSLQKRKSGDRVPVTVLRAGERVELKLLLE
jgi:serine protease Do